MTSARQAWLDYGLLVALALVLLALAFIPSRIEPVQQMEVRP